VPGPDLPLVDQKGTIKVAPSAILQRRMIPWNNEPVVQWLISWVNLPESEATWENADFIRKVFLTLHPWGQGCLGRGNCQEERSFSFVR
jgi:hypothetical protein